VEHDAVIEDHCHISTGTIINGGVQVGRETFIGSGSVTKEYITITSKSFIPANSLIGKNQ
jgi:UDP-3-O-[3-hydroxymyristoyl] glucosamine N-acyltransferase